MAIRLRTTEIKEITDPMLIDINEQKKAAFLETMKHLKEAKLCMSELTTEIGKFKSKIIKIGEEYQQSSKPLPSLNVLIGEKEILLNEYMEFKSVYVKVSVLAYKTLETINYLKPTYRVESEERYFQENLPDFYAQVQESERVCSEYIVKLQKLFTKIIQKKSVILASIHDSSITRALENLNSFVENKNIPRTRTSQLFNYISCALTPSVQEPSATPKIPRKRVALSRLNIEAIPPYSPDQRPPLNRRVSLSPSRSKLHLSGGSTSPPIQKRSPSRITTSSPHSLTFSSGTSTSSPRNQILSTKASLASRNVHHNSKDLTRSWETISLSSSSPRTNSLTMRDSGTPKETQLSYSYRDRGLTSSRDAGSPREIYSSYSHRDRGLTSSRDSGSPREIYSSYSCKDRLLTTSKDSRSPRRDASRDMTGYRSVYRANRDRKPVEHDVVSSPSPPNLEKRSRHSLKSYIQQRWNGKSYERDSSRASSYSSRHY